VKAECNEDFFQSLARYLIVVISDGEEPVVEIWLFVPLWWRDGT
jgi:hypothetical protein